MSKETSTPGDPTPRPKDPQRVDRLIQMAIELSGEVEELAIDSGKQFTSLARTARKNRMMIWALMASLLLDVVITVVLGIVGAGVVNNTNRIDEFSQNLENQQTEQRRRALCPLYGIFLDSKSEAGRKNAPDPQKYDHAFEVIEEGYVFLGCDTFLKESGKNQW